MVATPTPRPYIPCPEAEVERLVYKLNGLTEREIGIVEEK
jgi:hypothetical protein